MSRVPTLGLPGHHDDMVDGAMLHPKHSVLTSAMPRHGHNQGRTVLTDGDCCEFPQIPETVLHFETDEQIDSGCGLSFNSLSSLSSLSDSSTLTPAMPPTEGHQEDQIEDLYSKMMLYDDDIGYESIQSTSNSLNPDVLFSQDCDGDTHLHTSIININAIMACRIISSAEKPQHLQITNNLGQTPLHLTAICNLPAVTATLIHNKVPLETRDRNGNTALHLACREGHKDVAMTLLTAQRNLAQLMNYDGLTCLHAAADGQHNEILTLLLHTNTININQGDGCAGRTVLHRAVQTGQQDLVHFLIACKADVNVRSRDNISPLMIAQGAHNTTLASLLLYAGAVPHSFEDDGFCSESDTDSCHSGEWTLHRDVERINLNMEDTEEDLYS